MKKYDVGFDDYCDPEAHVEASLSPRHAGELQDDSAVDAAVIQGRGYRTITDAGDLRASGFARSQRRAPGLLVPMYGPDGEVSGHQFKPDQPREGKTGKPVKYETPLGSRVVVDCPTDPSLGLADPSVPLWITEGAKKADAARSQGLCCLSLQGVDSWRGKSEAGGETAPLREWDEISLAGRKVYVAYDSDVMTKDGVQIALRDLTRFLSLRGAQVWWVTIPSEVGLVNEQVKVGLDDWFASRKSVADLVTRASRPEPSVRVDGRAMKELTREAIAVLVQSNDPPRLFQREGQLVEARQSVGVTRVARERLRHLLSESAEWFQVRRVGEAIKRKPVPPPNDVVADVSVASELWAFPTLNRIVATPVFAADGSLRTEPGYHPASRSLYLPPEGLIIPAVSTSPDDAEVQRATALITDLYCDFAFATKADRAHAWALMLQPFARELIRGQTPLFGVEAPKQGTGKTILVLSALAAAVGEAESFAEPHGDEEMEKRLTASFMNADPVVFFDNIDRVISYPSMASALTKSAWKGRVLGQSTTTNTPILCTWVLTANNPTYSDDMGRRVVPIRLDTGEENPAARQGFTHSLPSYALTRRGELVWAACTLIASWVAAGRPAPDERVPAFGSYGPWRRVMGGILTHVGVPGLLGNLRKQAVMKSPEQETFDVIAATAADKWGEDWFYPSDLALLLYGGDVGELYVGRYRDTDELSQRLGYFFRARKGQVVTGLRLERQDERRKRGNLWRFKSVEGADA